MRFVATSLSSPPLDEGYDYGVWYDPRTWADQGTLETAAGLAQPGGIGKALYEYGTGPAYTDVKDVPGDTFRVKASGVIEVLTGAAKGQVFDVASSVGKTVIANLSDVRGNAEKLAQVLGEARVKAAQAIPRLPASVEEPQSALPEIPITQRTWFWPAVIGVAALGVGTAIVYGTKR